jgi:hypothetical protein
LTQAYAELLAALALRAEADASGHLLRELQSVTADERAAIQREAQTWLAELYREP